jgi:alanine racemase
MTEAPASSARATRAEIDLQAVRHNASVLARHSGAAELWAVVKANAYGHGAIPCAHAALAGGAKGLCVALTQEAIELRAAGINAPLMVLSEQPIADIAVLVAHDVVCAAYNEHYIAALAHEASKQGKRCRVHLKIDTGMHRVGVATEHAVARASTIVAHEALLLEGVMTHLATADDPSHGATAEQLSEFGRAVDGIRAVAPELRHVHAANSAATLRTLTPSASLVRAGIALYGLLPGDGVVSQMEGLRPAMTLRTKVLHVQRVAAGQGVSYGFRTVLEQESTIATLPIGYADGISRRSWQTSARVLIGGKKRRIVGVVTMDQMMIDCGDDTVHIGDDAVIFGEQDGVTVSVTDWARALDTISYEVVCAISGRVPRDYLGA